MGKRKKKTRPWHVIFMVGITYLRSKRVVQPYLGWVGARFASALRLDMSDKAVRRLIDGLIIASEGAYDDAWIDRHY